MKKRRRLFHLKFLSHCETAVEICASEPVKIPIVPKPVEADVYPRGLIASISLQLRHKARLIEFSDGSLQLLEAAIQNRVFDALDRSPMNLDELARETGALAPQDG